jgi:hypothetical protein
VSTLADLAVKHLGKEVRVTTPASVLEGYLWDFKVDTDWVEDWDVNARVIQRMPGHQSVTLTIGPWETSGLPLETKVEFL